SVSRRINSVQSARSNIRGAFARATAFSRARWRRLRSAADVTPPGLEVASSVFGASVTSSGIRFLSSAGPVNRSRRPYVHCYDGHYQRGQKPRRTLKVTVDRPAVDLSA